MKQLSGLLVALMAVIVGGCSSSPPPIASGVVGTPRASSSPATGFDSAPPTASANPTSAPVTPDAAPTLTPPATSSVSLTGERLLVADVTSSEFGFLPQFTGARLVDPLTGTVEATDGMPAGAEPALALSPDGRFVASRYAGPSGEPVVGVQPVGSAEGQQVSDVAAFALGWRSDGRLSYVEASGEIWVVGASGAGNERLADLARLEVLGGAIITTISWAPDGRFAALSTSDPIATEGTVLFDATTRTTTPLDVGEVVDASWPAWSPDGATLAFAGRIDNGSFDIYVLDMEDGRPTGPPRQISTDPANEIAPVWSPDSSQLAYGSDVTGTFDIIVSAADGSDPKVAHATEGHDVPVAWATFGGPPVTPPQDPPPAPPPTGQLMFADFIDDTTIVTLASPTGEVLRELTLDGSAGHVRMSPDGRLLAFLRLSDRGDGTKELYVIGTDGAGLRRLATVVSDSFSWAPAGAPARLAFYQPGGTLTVVNPDGSGTQSLAQDLNASDHYWPPAWRPDGGAIAVTGTLSGDEWGLYVVETTGEGRPTAVLTDESVQGRPAWVSEQQLIYEATTTTRFNQTTFTDAHLAVIDVANPSSGQPLENAGEGALTPFVSPTGTHIAFSEDRPDAGPYLLRVLEVRTGRVWSVPGGGIGTLEFGLAWSPDGAHLAYTATDDLELPGRPSAVFVAPLGYGERVRVADSAGDFVWTIDP